MIITAVADENYLKHIRILLKSLYISNPTMPIHIRLVEVEESDEYKDINPNTIITYDNTQHNSEKDRFPMPNGKWDWHNDHPVITHPRLVSDKMCYCVQIKYKDVSRLLDEGYGAVFSVDSDTIIRKDLTALRNIIERHDIVIMDNITDDSIKYKRNRAGWKEGAIGVKLSLIHI